MDEFETNATPSTTSKSTKLSRYDLFDSDLFDKEAKEMFPTESFTIGSLHSSETITLDLSQLRTKFAFNSKPSEESELSFDISKLRNSHFV